MSDSAPLTLDALQARLSRLHPKRIDLSLARMQSLLARLDHPERKLPPVIHVAGTNGKGSTIASLRAILEAAGQRVHVYTSPHLLRFNERIRLAGRLVDDETLIAALEKCERINAGEPITFFEIGTVAAFDLFAQTPADWLLLEVGLGGRYDATNVIDHPAASVITPVSIDHAEFLGDTVERIAHEKGGIFKRGAAGVQHDPAVGLDRERRHAAHVGVVLEQLAEERLFEVVEGRTGKQLEAALAATEGRENVRLVALDMSDNLTDDDPFGPSGPPQPSRN